MEERFKIGDLVEYDKKDSPFNGLNVISEIHKVQNEYQYRSNRGAWLDHNKCKLIIKRCEKTMDALETFNDLNIWYDDELDRLSEPNGLLFKDEDKTYKKYRKKLKLIYSQLEKLAINA